MEEQLGPRVEENTPIGELGPVNPNPTQEPVKDTNEWGKPNSIAFTPELITKEEPVEEIESSMTDYANVNSFLYGTSFNTGLNVPDSDEKTWDITDNEWFNTLDPNQKMAVSNANSEEYAQQIIARQALYDYSAEIISNDSTMTQFGLGMVASIDPTWAIPVGFAAKSVKAGYSIATKAKRLSLLAAENSVVSMGTASFALANQQASGVAQDVSFGQTNLFAGLLGGGLPIIAKGLGMGATNFKTAAALTSDPKNFLALSGELTADAIGGTQARTLYNRLAPDWLKSDVMLTAEADNAYITAVSGRIDSPSVAVVSRETGKPVPLGTTGQDYKLKFNGRQNLYISKVRAIQRESTITNIDDFNVEVGKVVRARSNKQEQAVYQELQDAIDFTVSEATIKNKAARDDFLNTWEVDPDTLPKGVEPKMKKRTKSEIKEYDAKAKEELGIQIDKEIETKKKELYENNILEFEHADPKVIEAAKRTEEYYKGILEEGKRLGVVELQKIEANRHYMTRIFDFQKVRDIPVEELVGKISRALEGHKANARFTKEQLLKEAKTISAKLKELDYSREFADYSFMVPKEIGATSFLNSRKFKFNDTLLDDILVTNMEDVVGQYSYSQQGHFAANHAFPELQGIPKAEQADVFRETYIEPIRKNGKVSDKESKQLKSLENMFQDMLGTLRIAADSNSVTWKASRITNSINSLTYGGGFALNTAAEIGGLLLDGHVSNVLKARLGTLKEIGSMFNGKGIEDPLARDFILMGQFENLFDTHSMQKFSDTDTVFNVGKIENNLNKANSEFFKYTGLRGATVALEAMVGPKVIHDLIDFSKATRMSLADEKYLARIGINHNDAKAIGKQLDKVGEFTKSGKIYDMHLDQWDDELLDKITTAVSRGMRHTVIKGDTTYLPSWMIKPNPFVRTVTQFLRYPMAATETLMARGLDESTAKWAAATMTSTFMMGTVIYAREQAAIQLGMTEESEAKYSNFWEDEDKANQMFWSALTKAGTLGGSTIMMDKMAALAGVPTPGHEYANKDALAALMGPTFSRIPQLSTIINKMVMNGELDSKAGWYSLKAMMPGATVPIINEYLSTQIKENTY